jgi:hypothetical protein
LELAQQINAGVFQGEAMVMKRSIIEVLPEIDADIAYFDPPYPGVMSYEREYKVIDQILEGHAKPTSPFTAKDGAGMLDSLFERAQHIPLWILSLGNAVVGIEELEAKMARLGRETRSLEIHHQHLAAVATEEKKAANREFLVVGVDPEGIERLGGAKAVDDPCRIDLGDDASALVEKEPDPLGPFAPSPGGFSGDGIEQGHAALGDQLTSLRRHPAPVAQDGRDDPGPVRGKPGVALDRERRLG